jgi:uncharacterized protein (DUF1800 family)
MDKQLRALNRFGLGARFDERRRMGGPHDWLRSQIDRAPTVAPPSGINDTVMADALRAVRMAGQGNERERREARQRLVRLVAREQQAALTQRVTSDAPFAERLVAFWSNHLCVSVAAKLTVGPFAGSYEREVIRRHLFGRFEDMVLASARHPAMLFYLDNLQSVGPDARGLRAARRRGQQRGLNENYARELLELHTLGVDGGYTQNDVIELARMLTGWTVTGYNGPAQRLMNRPASGPVKFVFAEMLHQPGAKTLLGVKYQEAGVQEGERAIRALCRHPSTARFIARKLVMHFVADDPPAPAIDKLAAVFHRSEGDLREVSRALIDLPEAWTADTRKFRTPQDWLVAVMRAFSAPEANVALLPTLRQLRHPLWSPQAPKGFSDALQDWADPDSLLNRAELARTIAKRVARSSLDPRALLEVVDVAPADPLRAMIADTRVPSEERLALAMAAPAFQWR